MSLFCVPTGTSGPGGAGGDTAPGSGRAAKSTAATSRAAGRHHLPAGSTARGAAEPMGGSGAFPGTSCSSPAAPAGGSGSPAAPPGLGRGRSRVPAHHHEGETEQPRENRPKTRPGPREGAQSIPRLTPVQQSRAPSAPGLGSHPLTASPQCPPIHSSTLSASTEQLELRLPSPERHSRKFSWVTGSKEPMWQRQRCWGSAGGADLCLQLALKSPVWL